MPHRSDPRGIRRWTIDSGHEPVVRIGVILDQDAQSSVQIELPAEPPYVLDASAACGPVLPESGVPVRPGTKLTVCLADEQLSVRSDDGHDMQVLSLGLRPTSATPAVRGAGALVRDLVAGRGFHWQKRIDQTLGGGLRLLPGAHGVMLVNEIGLEDYLAGVITAEMGAACPADLLRAQCVVARSWLLAMTEPKHEREPFDRCNDDCCQRYQGTGDLNDSALSAVRETHGETLINPAGGVLDANYSKSCGGVSELARYIWGEDKPGIDAIVDAPRGGPEHKFMPVTEANLDAYLDGEWLPSAMAYCSPNVVSREVFGKYLGRVDTVDDYFRWTVRYTHDELVELLKSKSESMQNIARIEELRVLARGVSGRANVLSIGYIDTRGVSRTAQIYDQYEIRRRMHAKFLYSSAFAIRAEHDAGGRLIAVALRGAGWGHGAGLCQIGALGMALSGIDYRAICRHYYPASTLRALYG